MRGSLLFVVLILMCRLVTAQVVIIVENLPKNTPEGDSLYLATSYNFWNDRDSNFLLQKAGDKWYIKLDTTPDTFKFKITRGSWKLVETDYFGQSIPNRIYQGEDSIKIIIESWEDLPPASPDGFIKVIITSLPENTPEDATLYATGNFNKWNTRDATYKLKEQDGIWQVEIPIWEDTIFYKFTRGSWESVEGKANGQARLNRQHIVSLDGKSPVYVKVESWEDLSGYPLNIYTLILLLAAIQGFLLILAINTIQNNNQAANRILSILIFLLSVALIGKVSTYDRDMFNWLPRLLIVPDIIFFLYGPLFLLYIQRLLHRPSDQDGYGNRQWLHFLPFLIQLGFYFSLLIMPKQLFIDRVVDQYFKAFFAWSGGIAIVFNALYWIACQRHIKMYQKTSDSTSSFDNNLEFLKVVMWLQFVCLLIIVIAYVLGGISQYGHIDYTLAMEKTINGFWAMLSITVFFLGYYSMRQPEIFKLPLSEIEELTKPLAENNKNETGIMAEEMAATKTMVATKMREEKLYRNPGLTLTELADIAGTNRHSLSKVVNDGFGMNFNDFVNSYRIAEFKELALDEQYKNHTLLAIAYIVGFNSKSAFNRSFKKLEKCTPREFLNKSTTD